MNRCMGSVVAAILMTGAFCRGGETPGAWPPPDAAGSSPTAAVNAFFDVGPLLSEVKLPADQVFPRGQLFPFSFYSTGGFAGTPSAEKRQDQEEILNAGVTLIGPQYELNPEVVALAREFGRHAIYTITPKLDGKPLRGSKSFDQFGEQNPLPRKALADSIAEQVRAAAVHPEIAWWDITPEELRYWRPVEVEYLKLAVETIRANDPLQRPVMMYEPCHRDAAALTKLTPLLDMIVKGMYTNYSGQKNHRGWVVYSTQQGVQAREALARPELPVLALPEMFQEPGEADRERIEAWVRHDVYAALASGAQGVLVFSARRRPGFSSRKRYLDAYLGICRELTGAGGLGRILLFGAPMKDLRYERVSGPEMLHFQVGRTQVAMPPVTLANFACDRRRYVLVVNSAEEPVSGMVRGLPYGSDVMVKELWRELPGWIAPEGEFEVELPPLGVRCFEIRRGSPR